MRLYECICKPTRVCIYMYMRTYTQTHIRAYTYICTCTYTRIHAHTYTDTCTCTSIHRQTISATTPQRGKQYHRRTYASIYVCMHIQIYMHVHICAHSATNVSQMCALTFKEHLYNACITHTAAHAPVPPKPVQKCTQHSSTHLEFIASRMGAIENEVP